MSKEENANKKESPEENWRKIREFQKDYIPISSAVRLKFQPYDWWNLETGYVDDYRNLK